MFFRALLCLVFCLECRAAPITFEAPIYQTATPLSPAPANVTTNRPFDGQDGWSRSTSSATGTLTATSVSGEYPGGQALSGATYIGAKSGYVLLDPATRAFTFDVRYGSGQELGCGFWNDDDGDGLFDQSESQVQFGVVASGYQFGWRHKNFGTRVGSGLAGTAGSWYRIRVHLSESDGSGSRVLTMRVRDLTLGEELDFDSATDGFQAWTQTITAAQFGAAPEQCEGVFLRVTHSGSNGLLDTVTPGGTLPDPGTPPVVPLPEGAVNIANSGVWTWFNDNQSIVLPNGRHLVGYVRKDGNVAVTSFDPVTGTGSEAVLSGAGAVQADDHNNPSLTLLPDGRVLAVYSMHSSQQKFYHRTSIGTDPRVSSDWGAQQEKTVPSSISYSNTFRLSAESDVIHNFSRIINYNPTVTTSNDLGSTWGTPVQFIRTGTGSTRPYYRFCTNHADRIDMIYTDAHPGTSPTSIYHLFCQNGGVRRSDGSQIRAWADLPLLHDSPTFERGSVVYPYTTRAWTAGEGPDDFIPNGRAWTWDVHQDSEGRPVCVFSVQLPDVTGSGWQNHRIYYYYARWTGNEWQRRFIAHAGRCLYDTQPHYAGGICVDPRDTRVVYLSTNAANPFALDSLTNVPLAANARYEIYRGFTADGGLTFSWTQVTETSVSDNLRPVVPEAHDRERSLLWVNGSYASYTSYTTRVLGMFGEPVISYTAWAATQSLAADSWMDDTDLDGSPNFLEYALGGDPTFPDRPGNPAIVSGGFEFSSLRERTDAETVVEHSEDLLQWNQAATLRAGGLPSSASPGFTLSSLAETPDRHRVTADNNGARVFFRLKVKRP